MTAVIEDRAGVVITDDGIELTMTVSPPSDDAGPTTYEATARRGPHSARVDRTTDLDQFRRAVMFALLHVRVQGVRAAN